LASFPVTDIEINEVPIEDIIRQVFAKSGSGAASEGVVGGKTGF
jgi:hypothetical protein